MKRLIAILLPIAILAGALSACDEKQPYIPTGNGLYHEGSQATQATNPPPAAEQTLSLAYDTADSMNPYLATGNTNKLLFSLMYQPLFAVDAAYHAVPILCKSYRVSKDMKTYTFYSENATFSDGSLLTAQDVAASLLAAKESAVYRGRFTWVNTIRTTEDDGVEITLTTPYENLPLLLDIPIVKATQTDAVQPIGTGPYLMEASLSGLRLLRRSDWWCRSGDLAVTASFIPLTDLHSATELRDAFEFGSLDLVCADPGADTYVDFRCDYELWDCESGIFLYLACNEKSSVFSNPEVRAALTHAIDRSTLVMDCYRGFAAAATLPASPESPFYNNKLASRYGYDAALFAQAVENAGLQESTVKLLVNQADRRRVKAAQAIAEMLESCGLKVTISALSGTSYTNALSKGNYDLHLGQTKLSANMDLSAFFNTKGALNFGGMADATLYSLCQEVLANSGNYYTLHQTVMDDGILCPVLFRSYAIYVSRGTFDDLLPAKDNVFFYSIGKTMAQILIAD